MHLGVETPWGDRDVPLSVTLWPLLERIDGKRTGYQLLSAVRQHPMLRDTDERWLMTVLRQLRRSGVITMGSSVG